MPIQCAITILPISSFISQNELAEVHSTTSTDKRLCFNLSRSFSRLLTLFRLASSSLSPKQKSGTYDAEVYTYKDFLGIGYNFSMSKSECREIQSADIMRSRMLSLFWRMSVILGDGSSPIKVGGNVNASTWSGTPSRSSL